MKLRPAEREPEAPPPSLRFPELFEEQAGYVWLTLRRLGVAQADLEDLTHDVFVQVFRQLDRYDPSRPLKPWLFGFAFHVASHYRRRPARLVVAGDVPETADPKPGAVEQLLARERQELAWAALDELELNRRAVFILHEIDGCPVTEIAATLGVPLATAYSRLRLARADFAETARRLRSRQR